MNKFQINVAFLFAEISVQCMQFSLNDHVQAREQALIFNVHTHTCNPYTHTRSFL